MVKTINQYIKVRFKLGRQSQLETRDSNEE